ncbi:hypothetical protein WJX73_009556 [Symbiochloris irregularis]|uniref:Acyltransferase n=1 Tax=Symbiochloris irregularis TaxID=706552 RepID=A0AAW1Q017_9CHLO
MGSLGHCCVGGLPRLGAKTGSEPGSPDFKASRLPPPLAAFAVLAMGILWSIMGGAVLLATDSMQDASSKHTHFALSAVCLLVGAFTTHGLAGRMRHAPLMQDLAEEASHSAHSWRFWQPFKGGKAFVATQALGWALFATALCSLAWLFTQVASGIAYYVQYWVVMTSSIMLAGQVVLGISIFCYKRKELKQGVQTTIAMASWSSVMRTWNLWAPILMFYVPVHMFAAVFSISFLLLPLNYAAAFWVGSMTVYYLSTTVGEPEHTGRREWPRLQEWLLARLEPALAEWFGSVDVVYEGTDQLDMGHRYVFGYHPHGLFPIGAPYLKLLSKFKELFPNVDPVPLVATVCFYTPVVRDFCSWCGVRQVARKSFVKALRERGSVLLVPGGQAELVHTWRLFGRKELVVHCRHKGFIKVAAEEGAALVPIAVLGEVSTLRNLIDAPWLQHWSYKRLGFPVPYLLVGRWGFTPFPRPTCLRFIVGQPIPMPPEACVDGQVNHDIVDKLHKQYFDQVEALFRKHMPTFPGYENLQLVMIR